MQPSRRSPVDSKNNLFLDFFLQPQPKSQWGIKSRIGCDKKEKGTAYIGFKEEAAMAPPTNACAVAVICMYLTVYQPYTGNIKLW